MNAKLLLKTVFLMLVVLLLVMVGINNRSRVEFTLPPLIPEVRQPAAIMYVSFFALGFIAGTVMTAGGKKGSSSGGSKPAKSGK